MALLSDALQGAIGEPEFEASVAPDTVDRPSIGNDKASLSVSPDKGEGPREGLASPDHAERITALLQSYLRRLRFERNLSAYTLRNYATDIQHFIAWWEREEATDPLTVSRQAFRRYLAALADASMARGSIARKVSTIHTFYRHLVAESVLPADPLRELRPPKKAQTLPHMLTAAEIDALLVAPDGESEAGLRDRAILELLYAAGVRVRELTELNLSDLDQHERTLRVTGKGNKQRITIFGEPAERALGAYLTIVRPRVARDARQPALFLNRDGGRLSVRAVELLVRKYALAAGIDQRTFPHLLRHTFATHLLDGGADVRIVQELLGHSSAATTQIYTHVTEQRQRKTYTEAFYNQWQPRRPSAVRTAPEAGVEAASDRPLRKRR